MSVPPVLVIASTTVRTAAQAAQSCGDISAVGAAGEALVELRGAGALEAPVPGQRPEPGAADHRPRRVGRVGHEAGELAHRVGDVDDVVVDAAGQQREVAELAPARVVGQLEGPGLDDLEPELLGRRREGAGVGQARRIGPGEQQHARRQPRAARNCAMASAIIDRLGMVWRRFGGAVLGAQRVVGVADVEEEEVVALPERGRHRLDLVERQVEQHGPRRRRRDGRDRRPRRRRACAPRARCAASARGRGSSPRRSRPAAPSIGGMRRRQAEPGVLAAVLVGRVAVAGEVEDRDGAVLRRRRRERGQAS